MRDGGMRSAEVTRATVRATVPLLLTNCPALIGTTRPSGGEKQDEHKAYICLYHIYIYIYIYIYMYIY